MFFSSAQFSESSRVGVSVLGVFPPQGPLNFCAAGFDAGIAAADVSWHLGGAAETPDPRVPADLFLRLFLGWRGDG